MVGRGNENSEGDVTEVFVTVFEGDTCAFEFKAFD
jgi:hypothetical protein